MYTNYVLTTFSIGLKLSKRKNSKVKQEKLHKRRNTYQNTDSKHTPHILKHTYVRKNFHSHVKLTDVNTLK